MTEGEAPAPPVDAPDAVPPASAPVPSTEGEATCPACGAPPSPGSWCMACGASFATAPKDGTLPPGGVVTSRKFACDGCGSLLRWDAVTGAMKCPFCAGTKAVARAADFAPVEYALEHVPASRRRDDAPKVFHCDDCGAEVRFEGVTVADRCPFCGAEHVVERRGDAGRILPESVVPFAVDAAKARAVFRAWVGKGLFRPRRVLDRVADEALQGVYVPYWTYDATTWSRWTAMAGHYYHVTVPDGRGGTRSERRTRWTPASGERDGAYDDVLICASKGVDAKLLPRVEPFELTGLTAYRAEYLAGWLAEEYVVDLPSGWAVARERINELAKAACARDVPGDTHASLRVWTQHHAVTWKHVLLPMFLATYRYAEKTYKFLVNGQTGKVTGTRPVSKVRVAVAIVLGAALVGAAAWFFGFRK